MNTHRKTKHRIVVRQPIVPADQQYDTIEAQLPKQPRNGWERNGKRIIVGGLIVGGLCLAIGAAKAAAEAHQDGPGAR